MNPVGILLVEVQLSLLVFHVLDWVQILARMMLPIYGVNLRVVRYFIMKLRVMWSFVMNLWMVGLVVMNLWVMGLVVMNLLVMGLVVMNLLMVRSVVMNVGMVGGVVMNLWLYVRNIDDGMVFIFDWFWLDRRPVVGF